MSYDNNVSNQAIHCNPSDYQYSYAKNVGGFTLIELMISLVLGLLISAAVIQIYVVNTRTLTIQQSASEVQDSSIFALQALEDHVRLANLGNPITSINDKSDHGGIVLTPTNLGTANSGSNAIDTKYLTNSAGSAGWTGVSNIANIASDQLTIQYKNLTPNALYDCEGTEVTSGSDSWVVERYFVRLATGVTANTGGIQDLVLACAAGRVSNNGAVTPAFMGNGEVIIAGLDQFKVLLGTQVGIDKLTYLAPNIYLTLTEKPSITTIKLGAIVRSSTPLITNADQSSFSLLGTEQNLKTDASRSKYYRRSYETTVLLRNARVMQVVATAPKTTPTT